MAPIRCELRDRQCRESVRGSSRRRGKGCFSRTRSGGMRKAIGWISMTPRLDFRAAEKEFRRALELSPGDAGAKNALSYALMAQGRLAEAEQTCREAILLDP